MRPTTLLITFSLVNQIALLGCSALKSTELITTNQQYIEQSRVDTLDMENIPATFERVFSSLPTEVIVYPTENYYYFKMYANHREIWGNLRLDSIDRDKGFIDFAYFEVHGQTDPYFNYARAWHKQFGEVDNVAVVKHGPLEYSVAAHGKTVLFKLNPLEQKIPSGMKLRDSEEFISRNFDESGFQFALLFDKKRNAFRYVLDESVALPDRVLPFGKDVFVGLRSGFAFYQEADLNRKFLFGVDEHNVLENNYYDGPFDQLADNFIDANKFEQYVNLAYPFYAGKVRGRGDFVDERGSGTGSRVLISAYFSYKNIRELWTRVIGCQKLFNKQEDLSACIGRDEKGYFAKKIESWLAQDNQSSR